MSADWVDAETFDKNFIKTHDSPYDFSLFPKLMLKLKDLMTP
jgi:hypothetical protein